MTGEQEGRLGGKIDLSRANGNFAQWVMQHGRQIREGLAVLGDNDQFSHVGRLLCDSRNGTHTLERSPAFDSVLPQFRVETAAMVLLPTGTVQERAQMILVIHAMIWSAHNDKLPIMVDDIDTWMGEELPYYWRGDWSLVDCKSIPEVIAYLGKRSEDGK